MRRWLRGNWQDIKGNVKYAVLVFFVSTGGTSIARWVLELTRGLQPWQRITVTGILTGSLVGCISSTIWALRLRAALANAPRAVSLVPTRDERLRKLREEYLKTSEPDEANLRPFLVATYERHEAVIPGEHSVPIFLEYLRLYNIGWELASHIRVDPITIINDVVVSIGGQPVETLRHGDDAEVQLLASVTNAVHKCVHRSQSVTLPLVVRYQDRGGKEWSTLHSLSVIGSKIQVEPVRAEQYVGWTKLE